MAAPAVSWTWGVHDTGEVESGWLQSAPSPASSPERMRDAPLARHLFRRRPCEATDRSRPAILPAHVHARRLAVPPGPNVARGTLHAVHPRPRNEGGAGGGGGPGGPSSVEGHDSPRRHRSGARPGPWHQPQCGHVRCPAPAGTTCHSPSVSVVAGGCLRTTALPKSPPPSPNSRDSLPQRPLLPRATPRILLLPSHLRRTAFRPLATQPGPASRSRSRLQSPGVARDPHALPRVPKRGRHKTSCCLSGPPPPPILDEPSDGDQHTLGRAPALWRPTLGHSALCTASLHWPGPRY